jgi:hypothetical protein
LYLQKGYGAGLVDFSYNEIVLDLGFSHTSEDQISDIKESIARLRLTRIYIYRGAELDVCREPIADFKPLANRGRSSRGQVCLNGWFVDQFVKNNFSVQSIEKLRDMNQTEKFLYRKISESDAADLIIPLPEFWKSGKSWRDGFVWDELKESQQNSTLRELRRALIGLKKLGLIKNESGVKRGTINLMPT